MPTWPQWGVNTTTWAVFEVRDRPSQIFANSVNFPSKVVYFNTEQEATTFALDHGGAAARAEHGVQSSGPGKLTTGTNPQNPLHALGGLAAIGEFFARLADPHTWVRVAEVLLGAGLIFVSLAHLQGATKGLAGNVARTTIPAGKYIGKLRGKAGV